MRRGLKRRRGFQRVHQQPGPSCRRDAIIPRLAGIASSRLHLTQRDWMLKFDNHAAAPPGPARPIRINSQTSPIEAPRAGTGGLGGGLLIERSLTAAREEEGNDL